MIRRILTISFFITFVTLSVVNPCAFAAEPPKPFVDAGLSPEKEAKIKALKTVSPKEAFESFQNVDFLSDSDLLNKAIFSSFQNRPSEIIDYSLQYLTNPRFENGKLVSLSNELYVAKKVFEVFPVESTAALIALYDTSDTITRGNIVRVSGKLAGGQAIRDFLISALDDKAYCQTRTSQDTGKPLRICDVAYNQLVLRYGIKGVLRTIGTPHAIETRDYHINILKGLL